MLTMEVFSPLQVSLSGVCTSNGGLPIIEEF